MTAIYDRVLRAFAVIAGLLLVFSMLLVTFDVIGRYFFAAPIPWAFEITEYILLYIPFLGMAWLVRRAEGHVRIDVVLQAFGSRSQARLNFWTALLVAATCFAVAYYGIISTWGHFERGVMTNKVYQIPKFLLIMVIPAGFALTAIEFIRKARVHYLEWRQPGRA